MTLDTSKWIIVAFNGVSEILSSAMNFIMPGDSEENHSFLKSIAEAAALGPSDLSRFCNPVASLTAAFPDPVT